MRLGKMLRLYRLFEGIEQQDVAASIGLTPSVLSRIESGKTCDLVTLTKLLAWLTQDDDGKPELVK